MFVIENHKIREVMGPEYKSMIKQRMRKAVEPSKLAHSCVPMKLALISQAGQNPQPFIMRMDHTFPNVLHILDPQNWNLAENKISGLQVQIPHGTDLHLKQDQIDMRDENKPLQDQQQQQPGESFYSKLAMSYISLKNLDQSFPMLHNQPGKPEQKS